jgi:hypothetical protein
MVVADQTEATLVRGRARVALIRQGPTDAIDAGQRLVEVTIGRFAVAAGSAIIPRVQGLSFKGPFTGTLHAIV